MANKSVHLSPSRVAAYTTAFAGLLAASAPIIGNLDLTSTAGVIAGVIAILGAYNTWAKGWREYESREDYKEHVAGENAVAQAVGSYDFATDTDPVPEVEVQEAEPKAVPPTLE